MMKDTETKFTQKKKIKDGVASTVKWIIYAILLIYCLSLVVPIIWMIFTSFKDRFEFDDNPFFLPKFWCFTNFSSALDKLKIETVKGKTNVRYNIVDMLGYSFTWAFFTSLLHVYLTATVAYVIARYKFFGCNFIYFLGIFIMITPIVGNAPSLMVVKRDLNIYNNMTLTILTQNSTCFSGMHFLILYAAFRGISSSYSEAAEIDGAGHFSVMYKIVLPMMLPTCAVIFVLSFLTHWNEYGTFLIWLPKYANLAYGMYLFNKDAGAYGASIGEVMAGFCIAIVPSMTLYLASQKLITSKFTVGGLKG